MQRKKVTSSVDLSDLLTYDDKVAEEELERLRKRDELYHSTLTGKPIPGTGKTPLPVEEPEKVIYYWSKYTCTCCGSKYEAPTVITTEGYGNFLKAGHEQKPIKGNSYPSCEHEIEHSFVELDGCIKCFGNHHNHLRPFHYMIPYVNGHDILGKKQ